VLFRNPNSGWFPNFAILPCQPLHINTVITIPSPHINAIYSPVPNHRRSDKADKHNCLHSHLYTHTLTYLPVCSHSHTSPVPSCLSCMPSWHAPTWPCSHLHLHTCLGKTCAYSPYLMGWFILVTMCTYIQCKFFSLFSFFSLFYICRPNMSHMWWNWHHLSQRKGTTVT